MKRWIALLLAMLMLLMAAGCQSTDEKRKSDDDDDRRVEEEDPDIGQNENTGYELVEVDNSIRNTNGDILVRRSYQKVVLLGDDPVYQIINQQIEADCQEFLNSGDYWTEEELEESIAFNGCGYDSFRNMAYASVEEFGDGVLRIRISVDWFMGGVADNVSYELVYDLETGEAVSGTAPAEGETDVLQGEEVPYDVVLADNSIVNENGDILVRRTYEKVVLLWDDAACGSINALIEADCEVFLENSQYLTVEDYEEMIERGDYGYDTFIGIGSVTVTHNQNGIFSFQVAEEHYQGGVYNVNYYGHTYDLTTGEEVKLADLLGMPEDEALAMLNEMSAQYLLDHYEEGLLLNPAEGLAEYTLDRYEFFVLGGELVLCFATYEFTCGAVGPILFYTGLFVN